MIRTTISRLKKVCSVAFIPRLLRGDQRYAAGKLETFSYAVLKKAQKSTKSTDDDEPEPKKVTQKDEPEHEYLFVRDKEPKLPEKSENETETSEIFKESITPIVAPELSENQSEKCQRIIDKAFGKEEDEPVLGEQYYSSAALNIEETRRAITKAELAKLQYAGDGTKDKPITDERIQFGVFKSRDINKDEPSTEPERLISNSESLLRAATITAPQNLPEYPLEQSADELSFLKKSLRVLPSEEGNSDLSEKNKGTTSDALPTKKASSKLNDYINILTSSVAKEKTQHILTKDSDIENVQTLNEANVKQGIDIPVDKPEGLVERPSTPGSESVTKLGYQTLDETSSSKDERKEEVSHCDVDKIGPAHTFLSNTIPPNIECKINAHDAISVKSSKASDKFRANATEGLVEHTVKATTAKETEEKLTQKIDNIDESETPLVEAHNPKLEGFNITPRALGNEDDKIKKFTDKKMDTPDGSSGIDMPASYDEVAKRCLDTPTSQIDEILLKEMEKLGIPITGNRDPGIRSPVIENDLVQMDVLKKPRRPVEKKDIDLESHEYERGSVDLCEMEDEGLYYPERYICKESLLPDYDEAINLIKEKEKVKEAESSMQEIHPNQVLIDPYDKKTIAYDTGEYDPNEWCDPHRKYSYLYTNVTDPQIRAANPHPTKDGTPDNVEEVLTPAMSPNNNSWFHENTQRYEKDVAENHAFVDSEMSERQLLEAEAQKQYEKNISNKYNYTKMNDSSSFWQNSYPQAVNQEQKNFKGQTHYNYANPNETGGVWQNRLPYGQSQQAYQQATGHTFNYDYSKNPYVQQPFAKDQEARNAEFSNLNAAESAAKSEPQAVLPQTTQWAPLTETHASKTATKTAPYYDFSNMNTPENVVNITQTSQETQPIHKSANINATENKVDKLNPKGTENRSSKVKSLPLPPPSYQMYYTNLYKSQCKPGEQMKTMTYPQREKQPDATYTKTFTPLTAPELLHSFIQEERAFEKRIQLTIEKSKATESDDWRKIPLDMPPRLVTHQNKLYQKLYEKPLQEMATNNILPEAKTSETVIAKDPDFKFNTNTNVSDDIWDSDQLDPQSTTRLSHATFEKIIGDNIAEPMVKLNKETPKKGTTEDLWERDQLDPNHVLTCNETCPIALRPPSINNREASRLEAIFEGNFAKADLLNYSEPEPELETPEGGSTSRPRMNNVSNLLQADSVLSPMIKERRTAKATSALPASIPEIVPTPSHNSPPAHTSPTHGPDRHSLPSLSDDVSLSELLRRVRERNRLFEHNQNEITKCAAVEPAVGKCPRKAPRCPPTAPRSPPNNPVPPPSFGLPMLKPRPRACPPKKKPSSNKFSTCDLDMTSGLHLGNQATVSCPEMICEMNDVGAYELIQNGKITVAELTEEVIERLHNLGKMLGGLRRSSTFMLARDYEPWSPIPSWPTKKLPKKKPWHSVPGGKVDAPPKVVERPCELSPCQGFPKKHFSPLDCFAVSMGYYKVYYLGEF